MERYLPQIEMRINNNDWNGDENENVIESVEVHATEQERGAAQKKARKKIYAKVCSMCSGRQSRIPNSCQWHTRMCYWCIFCGFWNITLNRQRALTSLHSNGICRSLLLVRGSNNDFIECGDDDRASIGIKWRYDVHSPIHMRALICFLFVDALRFCLIKEQLNEKPFNCLNSRCENFDVDVTSVFSDDVVVHRFSWDFSKFFKCYDRQQRMQLVQSNKFWLISL